MNRCVTSENRFFKTAYAMKSMSGKIANASEMIYSRVSNSRPNASEIRIYNIVPSERSLSIIVPVGVYLRLTHREFGTSTSWFLFAFSLFFCHSE